MTTMEMAGDAEPRPEARFGLTARTRTGLAITGVAVTVGVAGDLLLRASPWGISLPLWTALLVAAIVGLQRWTEADDAAVGWIPLILGAASLAAWRDSPTLKALSITAVLVILALAMMRARGGSVRLAGLAHHALGIATSAGDAAIGAVRLLSGDVNWSELRARSGSGTTVAVSVLRGAGLAVPLLLLFGALLVSADARFESLLGGLFQMDTPALILHLLFSALVAWIAGGVLRTMTLGGGQPGPEIARPASLSLGIVETATALGLLNLLFLAFVIVQLPYFFGGAALIQAPGSATFSDYARRGFFELVTVAGLVLPMLLAAEWLVRRETAAHHRVFRLVAGAQVALLFVMMGSGVHRMRLYWGAYGLTELRVYTMAFMLWLGVVAGWFAWTVLRGQRQRFAWGALVAAFDMVALLHLANPDALIVRVNASRPDAALRFDGAYAATLSADAVPQLLAAMPAMSAGARCRAAEGLLARWSEGTGDWRSWSLARARAGRAMQANTRRLETMSCPEPAPVPQAAPAAFGTAPPAIAAPRVDTTTASPPAVIGPPAAVVDPAAARIDSVEAATPVQAPARASGSTEYGYGSRR
ncbi:DUF4153 domain-containing protein [Longimicrobium terrae]|uniref:DUF4173 domain-containing protein n=1 Tax=Longimicrobium terrae TaxID=1639882 RepID=A0A841GZW5_9BACT|nr:DUF4173 domain-containing protein [Longimicrobium terrae]MBB4636698.1 hypothetical protein [Longimicrobium terrae]MBB6071303.1 hypothetical protein [Longimicrobium terrae]NNC29347.1 DUF4173 domain-containing protein [Longimicrobium terrae]